VSVLPAGARQLLLLAAAEPLGEPLLVWQAADNLGIDRAAADPAMDAGLVVFGTRVRFRHPLVRSAVYHSASAQERREAHRALAAVTDAVSDPDRRAWHRAQGTPGPDEDVAAGLERSAAGFWHWAVADIPASVTGLAAGAGDGTGEHLPAGAFHIPNDARLARFIGAGPLPGDGRHRYVVVVQALGIEKVGELQVQADSTPAWLGFCINISGHLLARQSASRQGHRASANLGIVPSATNSLRGVTPGIPGSADARQQSPAEALSWAALAGFGMWPRRRRAVSAVLASSL
jgi:phosphatidylethanolamine-binding protein (PEBP) family uncharacterized protein